MYKLKKHHYFLKALAGCFVLVFFLMVTNPNRVALGLLAVPIAIISFIVYELARGGFSVSSSSISRRKQQNISLIIAVAAGLLLMLQSIGQLVAGDLAIILFLGLVSIFYVSRFR